MFTEANRSELNEHGFTIVPNVISEEDCERHQAFFRQWLDSFPPGTFPQCRNSLIQRYKSGHMQPAWEVRLAVKPVFSQVWGTQKLLTSMDAIAIGRPPEESPEDFWSPDQSWLHVDQTADRKGLHAYQGAVYLETCDEDDWTFEVVKGSHNYYDDFMTRTEQWKCGNLKKHHLEWLEKKGCRRTRVPCPKGGMILWDSRLFHANARPMKGRGHPDRWRFVIFVCMTPALWATPSDLDKKIKAYKEMLLTTHWPSTEVHTFSTHINKNQARDLNPLEEIPEVARSEEAQRLAGVLPYEDEEGEEGANAEPQYEPEWDKSTWANEIEQYKIMKSNLDSKRKPHRV